MGNRAIIIFKDDNNFSPQVYVHWNGGPESILAFLKVMERRGHTRMDYAASNFIQCAKDYFRLCMLQMGKPCDGLSCDVFDAPKSLDEIADVGDNGHYIVTQGKNGFEVEHNGKKIKATQLFFKQLGKKYREGFQDAAQNTFDSIQQDLKEFDEKILELFNQRK